MGKEQCSPASIFPSPFYMQWWAVKNIGFASTFLHHLQAVKCCRTFLFLKSLPHLEILRNRVMPTGAQKIKKKCIPSPSNLRLEKREWHGIFYIKWRITSNDITVYSSKHDIQTFFFQRNVLNVCIIMRTIFNISLFCC